MQYLGEEIQGLKLRSLLECHAEYHWICVTSKIYNNSQHAWDKVRLHLQGIWHNENTSLDLIQSHKEIQGLRDAEPLKFDAAKTAADILEQLRRSLPSWSSFTHLAIVLLVLGLCVIVGLCLFPPLYYIPETNITNILLYTNYT